MEIRRQDGLILIRPITAEDPIFGLAKNPVKGGMPDAPENLDRYIYP